MARSLEPRYTFDENVVPPGNPVLERYETRPLIGVEVEPLPRVEVGFLRAHGSSDSWSPGEPAVVQRIEPSGVKETVVLDPGDPLPWERFRENGPLVAVLLGASVSAASGANIGLVRPAPARIRM